MLKSWCFSNRKKGETIVGRCCFVNGNCEELLDCSVLAMGRRQKVADNGVSAMGGNGERLLNSGVSSMGGNGEKLLTMVSMGKLVKGC
jgi:hypothetical protein